jgi:hypothetical protein
VLGGCTMAVRLWVEDMGEADGVHGWVVVVIFSTVFTLKGETRIKMSLTFGETSEWIVEASLAVRVNG